MAVAVEMTFEGATLDEYDQVCGKIGYEPRGLGEDKGLFHWAAATPTGLRVVDVWESEDAFQEFVATKLGPVSAELGLAEPDAVILEVHNYLYGPSLGR